MRSDTTNPFIKQKLKDSIFVMFPENGEQIFKYVFGCYVDNTNRTTALKGTRVVKTIDNYNIETAYDGYLLLSFSRN